MTGRRSRLAARRRQCGLSQEALAELLGTSRGTIARWERGQGEMYARQRVGLAQALGAPLNELDQLLTRDEEPTPREPAPGLSVDLKQLTVDAVVGFRLRDSQNGGRELYDEVVSFLSGTLAPHCFGVLGSSRADVFAAAASFTEMAGWMAYEAGDAALAARHFDRAHDLSSLSGDRQLSAHILASRSHLATETGSARKAGALARSGQAELVSGPPAPELHSKLLMYEARSAARSGDVDRCRALVGEAEIQLAGSTFTTDSPWLSPFDEASLANETARCCLLTGDYSEAIRQAQVVLDSRSSDRARSRVFAHVAQAQALVAQGDTEEAQLAATIAVGEAASLQSAPIDRQLSTLADSLGNFPD